MKRVVQLDSPSKWEKYDEGLKIEGVAITTGTFTGIDGNTINWTPKALDGISETLLGSDITIGHDGHRVGAVMGVKDEDERVLFRGLIWDPLGQKMIKAGKGTSIEATITSPDEEEPFDAISANVSRIAIVDRPAATGARIRKSVPVELEEPETKKKSEVESVSIKAKQLWPKVFDGLKDAGYSEDEARKIIDVLKKFISSTYPGAKGEAEEEAEEDVDVGKVVSEAVKARQLWPDVFDGLSDAGYDASEAAKIIETVQKFVKIPYPGKEAKERQLWPKVFDKLVSSGISEEKASEIIEVLKEVIKVPYPYPKAEQTEESEESEESKESEIDWEAKYKELKSELAQQEIDALASKIEEVDKEFDVENFLEDIEDMETQKTMLERYYDNAKRVKDSVKPAKLEVEDDSTSRADEISKKLFGKTISDLDIAGE